MYKRLELPSDPGRDKSFVKSRSKELWQTKSVLNCYLPIILLSTQMASQLQSHSHPLLGKPNIAAEPLMSQLHNCLVE